MKAIVYEKYGPPEHIAVYMIGLSIPQIAKI